MGLTGEVTQTNSEWHGLEEGEVAAGKAASSVCHQVPCQEPRRADVTAWGAGWGETRGASVREVREVGKRRLGCYPTQVEESAGKIEEQGVPDNRDPEVGTGAGMSASEGRKQL